MAKQPLEFAINCLQQITRRDSRQQFGNLPDSRGRGLEQGIDTHPQFGIKTFHGRRVEPCVEIPGSGPLDQLRHFPLRQHFRCPVHPLTHGAQALTPFIDDGVGDDIEDTSTNFHLNGTQPGQLA